MVPLGEWSLPGLILACLSTIDASAIDPMARLALTQVLDIALEEGELLIVHHASPGYNRFVFAAT